VFASSAGTNDTTTTTVSASPQQKSVALRPAVAVNGATTTVMGRLPTNAVLPETTTMPTTMSISLRDNDANAPQQQNPPPPASPTVIDSYDPNYHVNRRRGNTEMLKMDDEGRQHHCQFFRIQMKSPLLLFNVIQLATYV
jgi:hypothetical protein